MRLGLGRARSRPQQRLTLPGKGETVMLSTPTGGSIPARVLESDGDSLLVAITVNTKQLSAAQLRDMVLECSGPRGRLRLHGEFSQADPADRDLLRLTSPHSVEVLQERRFVRIEASRPVIVYTAGEPGRPGGDRVESHTVDLSGGGMLLSGAQAIGVGETLRFRLNIADGQLPVTGTARVVRIDPGGRRAVSFEDISDLDRRRLVRFIFECQRNERRRGVKPQGNGR